MNPSSNTNSETPVNLSTGLSRARVLEVLREVGVNLPPTASDNDILGALLDAAVKGQRSMTAVNDIVRLKADRDRLKADLASARIQAGELAAKVAIEGERHRATLVNNAVADGRITEADRALWLRRLKVDFCNEAPLLAAMTDPRVESPDGFRSAVRASMANGRSKAHAIREAVSTNPGGYAAWRTSSPAPQI